MNIQDLVGFSLESCRFSKSSYTLELCGKIQSEYKTFLVTTPYSLSLLDRKLVDANDRFSHIVWGCLERKIISIFIDNEKKIPKVVFKFDGNVQFAIFSDQQLVDNLLIVTDNDTGDWFPIS